VLTPWLNALTPSGPISPRIDPVNGDVWPEWAGAGWAPAIAGYPHLTVPMGDVHGIPLGVSFFGARNADAAMLAYGYAYEQATHLRPAPPQVGIFGAMTAVLRPETCAAGEGGHA